MLKPQLPMGGAAKELTSCLVLVWVSLEPETLGSSCLWEAGKPFLPLKQKRI